MSPFLAEFIGTALLVTLGNGVVANVVLARTNGHASGWLVITTGWAFAVTFAVYSVNQFSGAHLNPAVTVAMAAIGAFDLAQVPLYVAAQVLGAVAGATVVWLAYFSHWALTDDADAKRAAFCTAPAIRSPGANLLAEVIGTAVLVFGLLAILTPANLLPNSGFREGLSPLLVGVMVWAVGLSLGGATGYAINPARDVGPRIAHALLPIPGKGGSDWGYAWVPIAGPLVGGVLGALAYRALVPG